MKEHKNNLLEQKRNKVILAFFDPKSAWIIIDKHVFELIRRIKQDQTLKRTRNTTCMHVAW